MPRKKKPVALAYETLCNWGDVNLLQLLDLSDGIIGKAILREKEIAFDWISDEKEPVQCTHLSSPDGVHFVGYTEDGYGNDRARVEAVLYSNSLGHILLGQGSWEQKGSKESFIVQMHSGKPIEGE